MLFEVKLFPPPGLTVVFVDLKFAPLPGLVVLIALVEVIVFKVILVPLPGGLVFESKVEALGGLLGIGLKPMPGSLPLLDLKLVHLPVIFVVVINMVIVIGSKLVPLPGFIIIVIIIGIGIVPLPGLVF